ncbi:glycoside hydrolase family 65 protein [Mediterraneibacter hominis]|nr:glycosyl hydrolase family 65 protein [Mediterraneibacter hominis]
MEHYKIEKEKNRLWLTENSYAPLYELKTESIFAQCNGYMGVRAVHPFLSVEESRGMFLCGVFDKAYENEVTELVNCPDITWFGIEIDAEKIHTDSTKLHSCTRKIDILSGELRLFYVFELSTGTLVEIEVKRFASLDNKHLFMQSYRVHICNGIGKNIKITTGINGQITNSGVSHFHSVTERVYDREVMESRGELEENIVTVLTACTIKTGTVAKKDFTLKRRSIYGIYSFTEENDIEIEKAAYIYQGGETEDCRARRYMDCFKNTGYQKQFCMHRKQMQNFWRKAGIGIEGNGLEQQAAISFSQYHMLGMTPPDRAECSIAAKGLTGEGYKGHVFWDTEIFILPFLIYTYPEKARQLLMFRYLGLEKARQKAKEYGYQGAMFPWEAAKTGEEETPKYAALNIHTGKANRVWSGIKEYHVTADVIYAVEQYFTVTGDREFMEQCGYEMIFEAAKFWVSCAKWDETEHRYCIYDVIGPDEYTEHINNNAYTNYMAEFCVKTACRYARQLKEGGHKECSRLEQRTGFLEYLEKFEEFLSKIYLPKPGRNGIIPQDDTFLSKPCLQEIEKYKSSQVKQAVLLDYSRDEIVNMQVLKQADVIMLFDLFPRLFPDDIVRKNILFYEKRTLHDSSLSYCVHAQASAYTGDKKAADRFFKKALFIDLNDNPYDSADGIHSASMGGIWNCLIFGFAGVRFTGTEVWIRPCLPENWKEISFFLTLCKIEIQFAVSEKRIVMEATKELKEPLYVCVEDKRYTFVRSLELYRDTGETKEWKKKSEDVSLT